ncbi:MAG: dihydropteroate synthase [Marinilabiliales bacterium]|nr:dihydropteroate synthase [Marinilabiliales bacterium]
MTSEDAQPDPGRRPSPKRRRWKRACRAVDLIRNRYPEAVISVDTYRASVAGAAVRDAGADIINDISGGEMDADDVPPRHRSECAIHYDAHAGYTSEYAG